MKHYYQYTFANQDLTKFNVWDYTNQIKSALTDHYGNDLLGVDFSPSHYGFWLSREKDQYEHSSVGKSLAQQLPELAALKSEYEYICADGTKGKSTQIFKENRSERKSN